MKAELTSEDEDNIAGGRDQLASSEDKKEGNDFLSSPKACGSVRNIMPWVLNEN